LGNPLRWHNDSGSDGYLVLWSSAAVVDESREHVNVPLVPPAGLQIFS
jgi:hypothetical protein